MSGPAALGTAVITGAAQGIGAALVAEALARGLTVVACDLDSDGLDRLSGTAQVNEVRLVTCVADVADPGALTGLPAVCAELPPVTYLFANAGVLRGGRVVEMPISQWRLLFAVNVLGAVATVQAIVPLMLAHGGPGRIVVTGSTGSMTRAPGLGAYCATKHALWPVVESLRDELADTPLSVSLLMPGAVSTEMFTAIDPDRVPPADSLPPEAIARLAFAGADAGHAKILTHPAYVARFRDRFEGVLREMETNQTAG